MLNNDLTAASFSPALERVTRQLTASKPSFERNAPAISIGGSLVGPDQPVFVIAEIGINHNGSLNLAKQLVRGAAAAGVNAVKFQKCTPELCVPRDQWSVYHETPWGRMRYLDYKHKIELGRRDYEEIDALCRQFGIQWFASAWDKEALSFMERFDPPCHKAPSAVLTDHELLRAMRATGRPLILSTGMSTFTEIEDAVAAVGVDNLLIAHSTSTYPCPPDELNLRAIETLRRRFAHCPIGYSGHETGVMPTLASVALGATFVERHITLDTALWGSDQAASLDLEELQRLVNGIREVSTALGDGTKRLHESELVARRQRRFGCSAKLPRLSFV